uniref:Uncharacterized protein n=1 Tax=Glossina austeni TaxID=7395 RepID=A0A1A9UM74_GLOAU
MLEFSLRSTTNSICYVRSNIVTINIIYPHFPQQGGVGVCSPITENIKNLAKFTDRPERKTIEDGKEQSDSMSAAHHPDYPMEKIFHQREKELISPSLPLGSSLPGKPMLYPGSVYRFDMIEKFERWLKRSEMN